MPAPAAVTLYGNFATPRCFARSWDTNLEGVDNAELRYVSNIEDPFVVGGVPPGFPGMIIERIHGQEDGGGVYEHTLGCYGFKNGKSSRRLRGYPRRTVNLSDWDTVEDSYLTSNRAHFVQGQRGTYGGVTICTAVNDEPVYGAIYKVTGRFTGIIETKPYQRSITCNGNQVSGDSIKVQLPGGGTTWSDYRKAQVSMPRIVVTDRRLTTTPPPTGIVPGTQTPPNPPQVKAFSITGDDLTSHWPNGWSFSLESSQIPGGLYDNRFIYEYQWFQTP
jgi:hypothetical protein